MFGDDRSVRMRSALVAAVLIIVGVGVAAFVLSYETLRDLAELAGIDRENSWLFPVIVDGTIIQATVSVMVLSNRPDERRWFSWVLGVGAVVSVAGNSLHAFTDGQQLPNWVAAVIAAIAPIALLVDTHGGVMLFRAAQSKHAEDSAPEAVSEPEPDPTPEHDSPAVPAIGPEPVTAPLPAAPAPPVVAAQVRPLRPTRPVPVRPRPVAQPMLPLAIGGN
ncbi:DUF2637 domain-containing protein [Nocardia sp. NBC_00508]|uniref:DUF2637 domain-containing protein n=1 Tax=Nocardia sp. NBC_00508 TaxID=2975992 RepID=UPI002E80CAFC|nr:DUF2637 domain-containing protein [Nocardia sp. NBC_00508]WUD69892.1 DUF2637 domain-containing protein [Nocardia sp. NBC_00508]